MNIGTLLEQLKESPEQLQFAEVISSIEAAYEYTPQTFYNGLDGDRLTNEAGTNEGSCKVFAFAQLQNLDAQQTLNCFAEHYRKVIATPAETDHANIRHFMRYGWEGIELTGEALIKR